jgi:phosphoribosylformylglycinamidine (FGAM) synthase-like amidotransferase family enzyme
MPHPERACELSLGSADGLAMFESVIAAHASGALTAAGSAPA